MQELNQMEIIEAIIKKHKRFLEEYTKEFEEINSHIHEREYIIKRMTVLKEKSDQLENWIVRKNASSTKYIEEKNATDSEMKQLAERLKKIDVHGNANDRYKWLKKRTSSHKAALKYWEKERRQLLLKQKATHTPGKKASKPKKAETAKVEGPVVHLKKKNKRKI